MGNKICPVYKAALIIAHKGFHEAILPQECQCDGARCGWANDDGACSFRSTSDCLETAISVATTLMPGPDDDDDKEDKNDKEDEG